MFNVIPSQRFTIYNLIGSISEESWQFSDSITSNCEDDKMLFSSKISVPLWSSSTSCSLVYLEHVQKSLPSDFLVTNNNCIPSFFSSSWWYVVSVYDWTGSGKDCSDDFISHYFFAL